MLYLWVVLSVLAGLLNQQDKPKDCLLFYGIDKVHTLNLNDGKITATPVSELSFPVSVYISPDGTRKILDNEDRDLIYSDNQIEVQKIVPPIPFAWKWRNIHDSFHPNALWSPDGKIFVYLRNTKDNKSFVGLADPNGRITKEIEVANPTKYFTQLDSWSPDSQYFTVLTRPLEDLESIDQQITVSVFLAPDLTNVTPKILSSIPHNSCQWSNYTEVYCTYWSSTGHQAAFVQAINNNFHLVIAELNTSSIQRYLLPVLIKGERHDWFVSWSPDSEKVAVTYSATRYSDDNIDVTRQQLIIFYANKSKQITVDENANSALFRVDGPPTPQWAWSMDSNTMFYIRQSSTQSETFEAIRYNIPTNKKSVLVTFPSFNTEVRLSPSSDSKSVLVYAYNHEKAWIYLVSLEGKQLWSKLVDADYGNVFNAYTGWSLHSSYLATLKDDELIVYSSDGSVIYRKSLDEMALWESLDWIDCP